MVKKFLLFIFIFLKCFQLFGQDVSVEASINNDYSFVDEPIKGTITITHESKDLIDENSFKIGGKPLNPIFVQDVDMSSGKGGLVVTIYSFELPPNNEGEHELDSISVKVGSKEYKSLKNRYEVRAADKKPRFVTPSPSSTPPVRPVTHQKQAVKTEDFQTKKKEEKDIFILEAYIDSPQPLYIGQRAKFIYRIYYNRSVDLSESDFPMLKAEGFLKVGDTQIKDYQVEDITVQELIQEVEAIQPGSFQYGPSYIKGYAYNIDSLNQKNYKNQLLTSEVPLVEVTVSPLPIENEPESFTGGIGNKLEATIKLLSPSKVHIGDSIDLEISVTGPKNLKELTLPDLECQPGFSGFFEISPFPPKTRFENETKIFIVELRPISAFVKNIPSIELSSFNPEKSDYIIWKSEPIPLEMIKAPLQPTYENNISLFEPLISASDYLENKYSQANVKVSAIDHFEFIKPQENDIRNNWLTSPYILFIIPLSGIILLIQSKLKSRIQAIPKLERKSLQLLNKAKTLNSSQREEMLLILKESLVSFREENPMAFSKEINQALIQIDENLYGKKMDEKDLLIQQVNSIVNNLLL